jgi:uncharacterized protein (DUF3820 family)
MANMYARQHPRRRRVMPWGKHKGVNIKLLDDAYLSWLVTEPHSPAVKPEWTWLWDMLAAELRRRGFKNVEPPDPEELAELAIPAGPARRKYRAEPA